MRAAAALAVLLAVACNPQAALRPPSVQASPGSRTALAIADGDFWSVHWTAAESEYRKLAASGSAHAESHLALLLAYESRFVEAVAEAKAAVQRSPDSDTYARLTRALDWSAD